MAGSVGLERFSKAAQRVGHTAEERGRWLLEFTARELDTLAGQDWAELFWEVDAFLFHVTPPPQGIRIARFLVHSGGTASKDGVERWQAKLKEWQAWLRQGLRFLKGGGPWMVPVSIDYELCYLNGSLLVTPRQYPSLDDLFRFHVKDLLDTERHRLQFCRRQDCGRAFIASHGLQGFCSTRCSQTVRTRKYRSQHSQRLRGLRHHTYVRQTQKRLGPNVKVRSRRPKGGR